MKTEQSERENKREWQWEKNRVRGKQGGGKLEEQIGDRK